MVNANKRIVGRMDDKTRKYQQILKRAGDVWTSFWLGLKYDLGFQFPNNIHQ